ncbi:hypothetical protein, partial [Pseudoalteromonas sp. SIMBA_162]|uniref:hypothetical protein n=1 Tax=Pseudoalteromonas sp. SIMBA_162 TaxID=3080867 RepID=UPI0039794585
MARVKVNLKGISVTTKAVEDAVEEGIYDVTDDLIRTSSESAPHWKGILEQSYSREVVKSGTRTVATVDYTVKEQNSNGGFNYAYYMHEGDYDLGEKSKEKAASGGGVGMSGRSYPVGQKFLTNVLDGEEETYIAYIQKLVDKA